MSEQVDPTYIDEKDLSVDFTSTEIKMPWRIAAIAFQGLSTGNPNGTLAVEVSIMQDEWEVLEGCEEIAQDLHIDNKFFFILPSIGDYASRLRLKWTANAGSTGELTVAYRLMPQ